MNIIMKCKEWEEWVVDDEDIETKTGKERVEKRSIELPARLFPRKLHHIEHFYWRHQNILALLLVLFFPQSFDLNSYHNTIRI